MQTNKIFKGQCTQLGVVTDESGVMRCKGRLANSTLPEYTKYPILIPSGHHLSKLLIEDAHKRVMHNGVRETLNEIRSTFWLIRGRQTVRKILHSCVTCKRHEGSPYKLQICLNLDSEKENRSQQLEWILRVRFLQERRKEVSKQVRFTFAYSHVEARALHTWNLRPTLVLQPSLDVLGDSWLDVEHRNLLYRTMLKLSRQLQRNLLKLMRILPQQRTW